MGSATPVDTVRDLPFFLVIFSAVWGLQEDKALRSQETWHRGWFLRLPVSLAPFPLKPVLHLLSPALPLVLQSSDV